MSFSVGNCIVSIVQRHLFSTVARRHIWESDTCKDEVYRNIPLLPWDGLQHKYGHQIWTYIVSYRILLFGYRLTVSSWNKILCFLVELSRTCLSFLQSNSTLHQFGDLKLYASEWIESSSYVMQSASILTKTLPILQV